MDVEQDVEQEDNAGQQLWAFSQLAKSRARLMVQGRRTAKGAAAEATEAGTGQVEACTAAGCCAICLNDLTTTLAALMHTPCAHTFHAPCFAALLKQRVYTCPLCRSDLQPALRLAPPSVGLPTFVPSAPSVPLSPSVPALISLGAGGAFGAAWVHIIADDDISLEDIRFLLMLLHQEPIL